jgi:hypothetical protein
VPALVPYIQLVTDRYFLAGLNTVTDRFAFFETHPAPFVQREFGIDQVAVIFQQPADPHDVAIEDLLVGFEHNDNVPIGFETFLLKSNQIGNECRRHEFVVSGAATVKIALLFREFKRIVRPVLSTCGHNIDVSEQ